MTEYNVYLVRHGQSEVNAQQDRLTCRFDKPNHIIFGRTLWANLTPLGIQQARKVGEYFRQNEIKFDYIASSYATRTVQTARHCIEAMESLETLNPDKDEDKSTVMRRVSSLAKFELSEMLSEHHRGDWEGKTKAETGYFEEEKLRKENNPNFMTYRAPGGESCADIGDRTASFIEEKIIQQEKKNSCIFTHRGSLIWLAAKLFGVKEDGNRFIGYHQGGVSLMVYRDGKWADYKEEIFYPK